MIAVVAFAVGTGVGLWVLAAWLFPPRPSLATALARVTASPERPSEARVARLVQPAVGVLRTLGLPGVRVERDLVAIGRSAQDHLADKTVLGVAGLLASALPTAGLAVTGFMPVPEVPLVVGLALAVVGFVTPDLRVRAEAARRRTAFRHALSAYLDLVWITLAGGAGIDSALNDSAATGTGWAFARIRRALDTARLTRTTPWTALQRLGEELDVAELTELAASADLAGVEGARIRASLAAKARAMRTRQVIEAESEAQAATERMSLPVMALFLGFLGFIAYPALTQVLNGL
ncbi:type II secretion system F family protein [Saccharothrix variisporea]|uniref:Flp pilus assembly protein TadB n=1 Tax=Saccharothrix variisporea TaxID=543527 RepID=A0A495XD67_9PSEU|nr:type II secretion system F family protein [Saccharothrix variisporea]RKT69478.1 Flp pilus assembly protein TadB [Saccharothrix variisporea]